MITDEQTPTTANVPPCSWCAAISAGMETDCAFDDDGVCMRCRERFKRLAAQRARHCTPGAPADARIEQ
jgi:hypothetical protein